MDLLASKENLSPVQLGAQWVHLHMVIEVAEANASSRALEQGLVTVLALKE